MRGKNLVEVEISGLGVIERAHFAPGPGFTVITGETGAGKTMILSALSLLTGARGDATVVRTGSERANIVGRFAVDEEIDVKVKELGGLTEEGELLIARTITAEGKSRASIGGVSTTISALTEIGSELLSIHGQSANFTLLKPQKAREILDSFGGNEIADLLRTYQSVFDQYREVITTIKELEQLRSTRERELERISLFLGEFDRINPTPGESSNLRERILSLENVDATRTALANALDLLSEGEANIGNQLSQVKRALDALDRSSQKAQGALALTREISILVNELTSTLRAQEAELDVEPGELEEMHARRALVQGLLKRFGDARSDDPESALIEEAKRSRNLFAQLSDGDRGISELDAERKQLVRDLLAAAQALTEMRRTFAATLEQEISTELTQLAMPSSRIIVSIEPADEGLLIGDGEVETHHSTLCTRTGADLVTLLLIPHAGATPLPINKGASGGELSRIMLAIEVALAGRSTIPTYIFDEVDAGVGGKAAVEVGRRLARLAQHSQVLVVTHLPQVAAWADTHYTIRKSSSESVTSSDLALIDGAERAHELARMMAGREESSLAQEHAQELLDFVASERGRAKARPGKRA